VRRRQTGDPSGAVAAMKAGRRLRHAPILPSCADELRYMRNLDILRSGNEFPGTVHQPDDYFNRTVYWKGARKEEWARDIQGRIDDILFPSQDE
jgi:integrase